MSISIDTYCLQCLLRRNIALAQTLGTEEQAMAFAKEIMKLCINAPEGVSSPGSGRRSPICFTTCTALTMTVSVRKSWIPTASCWNGFPQFGRKSPARKTRFSRGCNLPFWGIIWIFRLAGAGQL